MIYKEMTVSLPILAACGLPNSQDPLPRERTRNPWGSRSSHDPLSPQIGSATHRRLVDELPVRVPPAARKALVLDIEARRLDGALEREAVHPHNAAALRGDRYALGLS